MEKGYINDGGLFPKNNQALEDARERLYLDMEALDLEHLRDDPYDQEATEQFLKERQRLKDLIELLDKNSSSAS